MTGQPIEDGGDARQLLADWQADLDNIMNSKQTARPARTKAPTVDLRRVTLPQTYGPAHGREDKQQQQRPGDDPNLSVTDKVRKMPH